MNKHRNLIKKGCLLAGMLYVAWRIRPYAYSEDLLIAIWIFWSVTAISALSYLGDLLTYAPKLFKHVNAKKPKYHNGKAKFATIKDLIKGGHLKRKGFLLGLHEDKPVWADIESNGLVLAPAGSGKNLCFVMPNLLMHDGSTIVSDLKGSNATVTAEARAKKLKNKVLILNPADAFEDRLRPSARYNPLLPIIQAWDDPKSHRYLLDDVRDISKQLLPDPPQQGENQFFRAGSRKLIGFAISYLVIQNNDVTLSETLSLISDLSQLEAALYIAKSSDAFSGDLRRMANDLLGKFEDGDRKQLESFREGALQVLEPYSPSGALAYATSASDFSFADLRKEKITVYLIADPTNTEVYESWIGLVAKAATKELMRAPDGLPVTFMLDEATNFKIAGLPKLLTAAREFKIRIWLIVQELEMFAEVYGKHAKTTLISQTEVKLIFGTKNYETAKYYSDMSGDTSYRDMNLSVGVDSRDQITRSISEKTKKLISPEEIMQLDQMLAFVGNLPPAKFDKIGYHEIAPIRNWAEPNPYHNNKPFKGQVKLRV